MNRSKDWSDHHEGAGDRPLGQVGVDGDVSGHVARPEPVHTVQHSNLPPMTASIDVQQDEVLEDLTAAGGVALHELNLLDLEHLSDLVISLVESHLDIILLAERLVQI